MEYDFENIEKKWQEVWEEKKIFKTKNNFSDKKFFGLIEFPYPSGKGLHVGHLRTYIAMDVVCRKRRMMGYNVLYPIGWDAFGLPTENFAIKNKVHPQKVTEKNIKNFRRQLKSLGISFDWEREIKTTDPEYYRWTQWIFLKLFEKNLAYKKKMSVNWCTSCKCVLANEEVIGGICERCNHEVIQKVKSQWMLKITAYAQRLIDDLDKVNYSSRIKNQQKNWIGKSEGVDIFFETNTEDKIKVYSTRPDTLFGSTYLVISPEHELINTWTKKLDNLVEIEKYKQQAKRKSDFERTKLAKEKTGVKLGGVFAINPVTKHKLPIFISDYVLSSYGTGAIMAVPAHDERDYEFAKKFNLAIIEVVSGGNLSKQAYTAFESGTLVNSDFLNGLSPKKAKEKIILFLETNRLGERKTNFKLRDWVFSRQRYWGEPIPIIYCNRCGYVPVSETQLPLELPQIDSYEPTETGESPLAKISEWINVTCPKCGAKAKRETDTMPQWAGSSWYFIRYLDPKNDEVLANKEAINHWLPIDWYNGGMEHTTLHLLYSRFWYKFLYDVGVVSTDEPYKKRTSHGVILGENSEKMSKSRGNTVSPDIIVKKYGADTLRLYEMFIGDFEKVVSWQQGGITGCYAFLKRYVNLLNISNEKKDLRKELEAKFHQAIKKVTEDIEAMKFNTAISTLMSLLNEIYLTKSVTREEVRIFTLLLSVFAPHITEEIWEKFSFSNKLLAQETWPNFDEEKCKEDSFEIALQVNGKVRDHMVIVFSQTKEEILKEAKRSKKILKEIKSKEILKEIYVKNKLINIVLR
ncbi:MAG: leucine--tRNA ligase [Oscillospiraceae bacterium]|nr:leucine--tRNA ligase [Oscillospiraceae bacterium]